VSTGWPAVRDRLEQFGIPFDPWQQGAGRLILAKRSDGIYAAGVGGVVISIPRQVGKTYTIGWIVFALCTLIPGLTVIWTAHHTRTSNETFGKMRAMARKAKVAPHIETVRAANGEQSVVFKNGSRILFGARDQGFGLGFDMVDVLVLDEGQRVKEVAMADMVPATNAAPNGLVIMMGTPPRPTDNGDVFASRRKDALDGDPDTLYIELSADPGAKIIDWDQVAKANPSYPHRTGKTAILRMQKLLGSDEGFYREGYGIWDAEIVGTGVIDSTKWGDHKGALITPTGTVVLGIDTSLDRQLTAVVAVGAGDDKVPQARVVECMTGTAWVPKLIAKVCAEHRDVTTIVIDDRGSSAPLVPAIEDALEAAHLSVRILTANYPDLAEACAITFDLIHEGEMRHASDPALDAAVRSAEKRESEGAFVWSRRKGGSAVVPLVAMSLALWEWRQSDYDVADSFL
jgi:phage terminase large subunit-like protein